MTRFALLVVTFVTGLSGCGVSGPLPAYSKNSSVIDYSESLIDSTTSRNLDRLFDTVDSGTENGYNWLSGWWCPRHSDVSTLFDVRDQYIAFCTASGGTYGIDGICRDSSNSDTALFVAKATETNECSDGPTVTLDIVEPIDGRQTSVYIQRIRQYGYETSTERTNREKYETAFKAATSERAQAARDAARAKSELNRAALATSSEGTRICKAGQFDFVITTGTLSSTGQAAGHLIAQLDGFSDNKDRLRFRVLGFDIPSRAGRIAPFASDPRMGEFFATPGLVYWDRAAVWAVCE